jgi:hypothetical protein
VPVIPLDFSNVESFDSLPIGKYFCSIDKIELREATDPTKFGQLQVQYLVIDGEFLGRRQSEFLSLSPKAAFRLKKWLDHFAFEEELTGLDIDEDTNQLVDPDLVGVNCLVEVYQDPKLYQGEKQIRTRMLEVLDDEAAPETAPPPPPARRAAPAPTPAPAPAAPARRAAPAPAPAPEPEPEEEEAGEEEEPLPYAEEEAAPAPAPAANPRRTFAPRRAGAAPATGPARRQLR